MSQNTLLLAPATWDLVLDAARNIALAQPPYALAQDVASAIKTFLGECYYDASIGVPYFQQVLGKLPPLTVFQELMVQAALTVPGVVSASCNITAFKDRDLVGQVIFTDTSGNSQTVSF